MVATRGFDSMTALLHYCIHHTKTPGPITEIACGGRTNGVWRNIHCDWKDQHSFTLEERSPHPAVPQEQPGLGTWGGRGPEGPPGQGTFPASPPATPHHAIPHFHHACHTATLSPTTISW